MPNSEELSHDEQIIRLKQMLAQIELSAKEVRDLIADLEARANVSNEKRRGTDSAE